MDRNIQIEKEIDKIDQQRIKCIHMDISKNELICGPIWEERWRDRKMIDRYLIDQ